MNRFQHENIDPEVTPAMRTSALQSKGINFRMSPERRRLKQRRHALNAAARAEASRKQ